MEGIRLLRYVLERVARGELLHVDAMLYMPTRRIYTVYEDFAY